MAQIIQLPAIPIAGIDFSYVVPADKTWVIKSYAGRFTTSVNPFNRKVRFRLKEPTGLTVFSTENDVAQGAGLAVFYSFARARGPSLPTPVTSLYRQFDIPNNISLRPGWIIETFTEAMDGTDQWDLLSLIIQEDAF